MIFVIFHCPAVQCVFKLDLSFLHDYIVHTVGYPHAKYQRPNPFSIEMSGVLKIGTRAEISLVSPATSERALSFC